jgi:hypothetical protein
MKLNVIIILKIMAIIMKNRLNIYILNI